MASNTEGETLPYVSTITTTDVNALSLDKSKYDVSLMVYVDETTTISHFYTIIDQPYKALKWDVSSVVKGTWVEMNQTFTIDEDAVASELSIVVPNHEDNGKGIFYVDDIIFEANTSGLCDGDKDNGFKIYPNPATNTITIDDVPSGIQLTFYDMMGRVVKEVQCQGASTLISVNDLGPGVYLVRGQGDRTYQQQLIIK